MYFREMSGLGVMSPEQELRAATRISDLRTEHWRRILSYPPFAEPIADFVAEQGVDESKPTAELSALRHSARAL
ncbi:MAG: RNA polymerase subunit sigma-70, partial [Myxococcales bacterium]|nr:RNA polymerase subunit sigma-70 [Myxococcales bacterium]